MFGYVGNLGGLCCLCLCSIAARVDSLLKTSDNVVSKLEEE